MNAGIEDKECLKRISLREKEAFSIFYDRHAPMVLGFLMKMFQNKIDAEEVLQETFWQIWKKSAAYDVSRGSPSAWLIQIARTRGIDRIRQRNKNKAREIHSPESLQRMSDPSPSTVESMEKNQDKKLVRVALEELPSEQRQAIQLAYYEGFTHDEVSKKLNLPLGTIKTRIRLGMGKLYEALKLRVSSTGGVA